MPVQVMRSISRARGSNQLKAMMIELPEGGSEFEKEVLTSAEPVIVDFYADWCGPCKLMASIFKKLADESPSGIKFVKVDTEVHEDMVDAYNIQGLPLFGVFVDGKMVASHSGALSKEPLRQFVVKSLQEVSDTKPSLTSLLAELTKQ